jgi:hypothetical protein
MRCREEGVSEERNDESTAIEQSVEKDAWRRLLQDQPHTLG